MKKIVKFICISIAIISIISISIGLIFYHNGFYFIKQQVHIDKINFSSDKNKNGVNDLDDILKGARKEVEKKTKYKSVYYNGGYPPDGEGVCTDVIWRGLKNAGIDLKIAMDKDIKQNPKDYINSISVADPNIDFRRVKNQYIYLKKFTQSLTTDVIPYDKNNLIQWQRGDIIVLKDSEHVAIVSDARGRDGVPLIIHNAYLYAKEENRLTNWSKNNRIIGHFRYYPK